MFSFKHLYDHDRPAAAVITDERLAALVDLLTLTKTLLRHSGMSEARMRDMPVIANAEAAIAGGRVLVDTGAPYDTR